MSDRIDPRYPAAFQRGYQGGDAHISRRATEPVAPGSVAPGPDAPGSVAPDPAAERASTPEPAAAEVTGRDDIDEREPRANPFIVLLWVLSLALSVGGIRLIIWAQNPAGYGYSGVDFPFEVIVMQTVYVAGGPVVTAGLLGIIGLLFWHAAAWRRRAIAAQRHPEH